MVTCDILTVTTFSEVKGDQVSKAATTSSSLLIDFEVVTIEAEKKSSASLSHDLGGNNPS